MPSVEDRVEALEAEVARIREQLKNLPNWTSRITGSMKDFPEFDEVVRLGRQIRREGAISEPPHPEG